MEWIIWVRLAIILLNIMQDKNKGEQISLSELERALSAVGVKDSDISQIKELLPGIANLVKDAGGLFKK